MSRPEVDRSYLDLQNAESTKAGIVSFVPKLRAETRKNKINTNGTTLDKPVTNLFLSMCRQDANIKLGNLMSPRISIDTLYKDLGCAMQNYISPKERIVTAENVKYMILIQGAEEWDDNFLACLREEARHCDIEKPKTLANPEEELVRIKFISGLRDPEAKLSFSTLLRQNQLFWLLNWPTT